MEWNERVSAGEDQLGSCLRDCYWEMVLSRMDRYQSKKRDDVCLLGQGGKLPFLVSYLRSCLLSCAWVRVCVKKKSPVLFKSAYAKGLLCTIDGTSNG